MNKMRWLLLAVAVLGLSTSPAFAYRFGNPGKVVGQGKMDLGATLEIGERDLEAEQSGVESGDVDIQGLTLNGRYGLGNGLELRGRLIPMTVTWDGGDGFDPNLFGIGAGIQWVPAKISGPLAWGLGVGFDYGMGDDGDLDLDHLDINMNGGVSFPVTEQVDVYGGLSFIYSNMTIDGPGGSADFEMDNSFGLFGGADFKINQNWGVGAELRLLNENMFSLGVNYSF